MPRKDDPASDDILPETTEDEAAREGNEARESVEHALEDTQTANPLIEHAAAGSALANDASDYIAEESAGIHGGHGRVNHSRHAGKTFKLLHPMIRDGKSRHIGEDITFRDDEADHVDDLLAARHIAHGSDEEVADALGQADLARAESARISGH